jgi:hypothetical protein
MVAHQHILRLRLKIDMLFGIVDALGFLLREYLLNVDLEAIEIEDSAVWKICSQYHSPGLIWLQVTDFVLSFAYPEELFTFTQAQRLVLSCVTLSPILTCNHITFELTEVILQQVLYLQYQGHNDPSRVFGKSMPNELLVFKCDLNRIN